MRLIALLATYNEERFVAACLKHLVGQGAEVYLIDNQSTDRTVAIAEEFRGRGLVDIATMPREGRFDLASIMAVKERLAATLEADWFLNVDADEFHLPPRAGQTLAQALAEVEQAGDNVVNFLEFTFVPTQEAPDHDHPDFQQTMRWYYLHVPEYPFLMRAWKKQPGPVGLAKTGGHVLQFPGRRLHPQPFDMRHYICLSADHAVRKYASRKYSPAELQAGWHGWRTRVQAEAIRLPAQADLSDYAGQGPLDTARLRLHDFLDSAQEPPIAGDHAPPICIGGLDLSGAALVARLLHQCGLYLGPEHELSFPDWQNPAGYGEHVSLVETNQAVLAQLGAGWDMPPATAPGWDLKPGLLPMRVRAAWILERFARHAPWGWKDLSTSLTWAFWKRLLPDLKVVIVLCHPLEAARSLSRQRGLSVALGLNLWLAYHERLLSEVRPEDRIVVHSASFFYDAQAELRRLVVLAHLPASAADLEQALSGVSSYLRHSPAQASWPAEVPEAVLRVYSALCSEAGLVYGRMLAAGTGAAQPTAAAEPPPTQQEFSLSMQLDRLQTTVIANLERLAAEQSRYEAALADAAAQLRTTQAALAEQVQQARTLELQLAENVKLIEGLQVELEAATRAQHNLALELASAQHQQQADRSELDAIHNAKFWRVMSAYWRARYTIQQFYHSLRRRLGN